LHRPPVRIRWVVEEEADDWIDVPNTCILWLGDLVVTVGVAAEVISKLRLVDANFGKFVIF
jgi:hypothetical protein